MSTENEPPVAPSPSSRAVVAASAAPSPSAWSADGHDLAITYRERGADAEAVAEALRAAGADVLVLACRPRRRRAGRIRDSRSARALRVLHRSRQQRRHHRAHRRLPRTRHRGVPRASSPSTTWPAHHVASRRSPTWPTNRGGAGGVDREHLLRSGHDGCSGHLHPLRDEQGRPRRHDPRAGEGVRPLRRARQHRLPRHDAHRDPRECRSARTRPAERAPRIPMRRAGQPDEVAGAVAFLLGPDASYISGANIRVAGGN